MMLEFEQVLTAARDCMADSPVLAELEHITIIRDVHGRVRYLLEPSSGTQISNPGAVLEEWEQRAAAALGPYFSGDIWLADNHRDGHAALVKTVQEERVSAEWSMEGERPQWHVLERHISKQHWLSGRSPKLPWPMESVTSGHKPAVISFYSFKGGVGRTTSLVGTALSLVQSGKRVAIVDLDLEAPGVATLFFQELDHLKGVIDYLLEKPVQGEAWRLQPHLLPIVNDKLIGNAGGLLTLLPAGTVDRYYLEKLARLDFQQILEDRLLHTLHQMLKELERTLRPTDYIFMDVRAGFHDIAALAVAELAHGVVIFGQHNRQTWEGIQHVVRRLAIEPDKKTPVVLVHAMAPEVGTPGYEQEMRSFREKAYDVFQQNYYFEEEEEPVPNEGDRDAPFYSVAIPWDSLLRGSVELYNYEAEAFGAYINRLTSEPYRLIAERIAIMFGRYDKHLR